MKSNTRKIANEYNLKLAEKRVNLSGTAIKAIALKTGGVIEYSKSVLKGSPVVITALSSFLKKTSFTEKEFLDSYGKAEKDFIFPAIKKLETASGKPYNNYKTFISRLKADIRLGLITGFKVID